MAGRHVRGWVVVVAAIMLVGCGDDGNRESLDAGGDVVVVDLGASDVDLGGDGSGPPERCTADEQCPAPTAACAVRYCDRTFGQCVITGPDLDADGHADEACDPGPGGTRGDDCDDANPRRFPTSREVCDAADIDEDCDPLTFGELDADDDGSFDGRCCNVDLEHGGERICGGDCDDANENVRPNDVADGPVMNCDTFDNDCDGTADEGCTCAAGDERPCGGGTSNESPAVCRTGVQRCGVSGWGECVGAIGPVTELCDRDRLDEDCDGETNEGCACDDGEERPCGGGPFNGSPSICVAGIERCLAGTWGTCIGSMGPLPAEICDAGSMDEDCDGEVNEGCGCVDGSEMSCGGGPVNSDTFPMSICQRGTQRCTGGVFGSCVGSTGPGMEQCRADGLDEDCDGTANEDCVCIDGQTRACGGGPVNGGTSICVEGTETCVGGAWGACAGGVSPMVETCDELRRDEDCDGMQNEGCGVLQVAVSANSTCVLRESGRVSCWGATSDETFALRPFDLVGVMDAIAVAGASRGGSGGPVAGYFCVLHASGTVRCGGVGTPLMEVPGVTGAVEVATIGGHSCARRSDGSVVCWGVNNCYQTGDPVLSAASPATTVAGISDAREVMVYGSTSCARTGDGSVLCWGAPLPPAPCTATPTAMAGLSPAVDIASGTSHACARAMDDRPRCWGLNSLGQLGRGGTTFAIEPPGYVSLPLTSVTRLDCGGDTCGAGIVRYYAWGAGPVGDGTATTPVPTPTRVMDLEMATQISIGGTHSCALFGPLQVRCWGMNGSGELGTGGTGAAELAPIDAVYVPE